LLGADQLMFPLPQDGRVDLYMEGHDPEVFEYPDWIEPWAEKFDLFERYRTLGSCTRAMVFDGHLDALYRSSYYNDYALKHRACDSLTLSVPVGREPLPRLAHHVQIIGNKDSLQKPPFGDREVALG